ncbi:hypothetical protein ACPCSE_30000 [Streptomyces cellulosae]
MSASTQRPKHQVQDANPYAVDMTEIPHTPTIVALHDLAKIDYALGQARERLAELMLDASALGLAEGHAQRDVLRAQGRPFSWRAQLSKLLKRRGIDVARQVWRARTKTFTPQQPPAYLAADLIADLTDKTGALTDAIGQITHQRDEQYPQLHEQAKAAIEGLDEAS